MSLRTAQMPVPSAHKLRRLAIILYATLGLLLLAMPDEILTRLDDFNPTPPVRIAQAVVGAVAGVSHALGLSSAFQAARAAVLAVAGVQQM